MMRLLAVAALASGALATPSAVDPLSAVTGLVPGGGSGSSAGSSPMGKFNPLDVVLHPVEGVMTNGERMRRGLPPKKPHFRRADRTQRARPRPSSTPGQPSNPGGGCAPRNGVIHVTAPGRGNNRPKLDGYLARTGNEFGEYSYTAARDNALTVSINNCTGSPFDIVSSNGYQAYPFLGGIAGFANDGPNLRQGSFNYVYIGGVTQTAQGATPKNADNSFTAATGIQESVESAIWSFRDGTNDLRAQWINEDGSSPADRIVYVPSANVFVVAGDLAAFEQSFGPAEEATFRFES
ncbi:hypothetical protein PsYK624_066650 [Phanerochaete sordida]|uniref:Uncharacterized protein n=1 Tax=Phanerochaete sordida TaxID=48140 RepID=A0A9P3GAU4_9APHY|nr:hypothetical protein PsYK624_066650 [Phanerochaete sordida]